MNLWVLKCHKIPQVLVLQPLFYGFAARSAYNMAVNASKFFQLNLKLTTVGRSIFWYDMETSYV